jgi:rhamnogalacturonyl hydrolase YesR
MKKGILLSIVFLLYQSPLIAQTGGKLPESPLAVAKIIGDKLIRETPFKYRLSVAMNNPTFNGLQFVDFGRTFFSGKPAVAYAYTNITAIDDMCIDMQIEHNDACKIWLNGALVYVKKGSRKIHIVYDERSIELSNHCLLKLHKGANSLLIKSETKGAPWTVYIQPPSTKGAVKADTRYPNIGLKGVEGVDSSVVKLTNWLIIGPFADPLKAGTRTGIDVVYPPEKEIVLGKMYKGSGSADITWTIPKVEVLGTMINPAIWGTNYNWNYHNGGVAWAMEQISELSGDERYDAYATRFCNFHLDGIPFVRYQVKTLNADSSANNQIISTNLLDFTLAPSLPLIYKLRKQNAFVNRQQYQAFVDNIVKYARYGQLRLPGQNNYTRTTPQKYTTWADDMFMGIPFLVQAALYTDDKKAKYEILNDAANQLMAFQSQVWDPDAQLYMHAHYSGSQIKLPHWSRANGWAIWAMSEVLTYLPKSNPKYAVILNQYCTLVNSLLKYQDSEGFWRNVLDRPDSKEEVSGTAIFTMAMARGVANGWLDAKCYKPVALKGWHALTTQIEPDGTIHNICTGTMCSEDVNYYLHRPFYDNDTHGVFAVLFAAIAMEKMLKN